MKPFVEITVFITFCDTILYFCFHDTFHNCWGGFDLRNMCCRTLLVNIHGRFRARDHFLWTPVNQSLVFTLWLWYQSRVGHPVKQLCVWRLSHWGSCAPRWNTWWSRLVPYGGGCGSVFIYSNSNSTCPVGGASAQPSLTHVPLLCHKFFLVFNFILKVLGDLGKYWNANIL